MKTNKIFQGSWSGVAPKLTDPTNSDLEH